MAKRTPPRPKSTQNLPPGLKKYWAAKGVPSTPPSGSTSSKSTSRKSSARKTTRKRKGKKS